MGRARVKGAALGYTQGRLRPPIRFLFLRVWSLDNRNLPFAHIRHHNRTMRMPAKTLAAALMCGLALCASSAQQGSREAAPSNSAERTAQGIRTRETEQTLTPDEGLGVIAAALDPKVRRYAGRDCSHLVHAIYKRAGFPYAYANSDDLYAGVEGFQRVGEARAGDLIVWHGHVGIVVRPSRHVFFSFMSQGPGVDDYQSRYWRGRGHPRFLRYVKNDPCPGCSSVSRTFSRREDR
jgi:NlpC/P60 family